MEIEFLQLRDDGTVDVQLGSDWPIFDEALADTISSLPPRGSEERRLSTYSIAATQEPLKTLQATNQQGIIAAGNAYELVFSPAGVTAVCDYAEDVAETMAAAEFSNLLERWREAVVEVQKRERREVPGTYRRNPWP